MEKPPVTKEVTDLQVFTIKQPTELVEVRDKDGKITDRFWRFKLFHFTTADKPVTFNGVQYIPISYFDQVKWDEVQQASKGETP